MSKREIFLVLEKVFEDTAEPETPLPRITGLQYAFLQMIARNPGICTNRAGKILGREHSSSYNTVKALVRMKLVYRLENPLLSSSMGIPLFVTPTGEHLLKILLEAGL